MLLLESREETTPTASAFVRSHDPKATTMFAFFRRIISRRKPTSRRVASRKPRLEVLEDRTAPAVAVDVGAAYELGGLSANNQTLGWRFTVNKNVTVNQLGFFDANQDGLGESHQVAIWDSSGDIVVQGTVGSGTSANLVSQFRYATVGDTVLSPGQTYSIGATFRSFGPDDLITKAVSVTADPSVDFAGSAYGLGTGLVRPNNFFNSPAYFGPNFQFTGDVDIAMQSAQLVSGNTVQFTYETTGNPGVFEVGLYRSVDGITYNTTDLLASQTVTPSPTNPQTPGTFTLPNPWTPNPGKPYLLLVADLSNAISESNEDNNSKAITIPDIAVASLTTVDSHSVTINYEVKHAGIDPFRVRVYRSSDTVIDANDQILPLANPGQLLSGGMDIHFETVALQDAMGIDPSHPYILVAADPDAMVLEVDESNNTAFFKKHVLGVVTHGYQFLGVFTHDRVRWVDEMAAALRTVGYEHTIAFKWRDLSNDPGGTLIAGDELATEVMDYVQQRLAGPEFVHDVIDVHFIGHSLGAVVISTALGDIDDERQMGTLPFSLQGGYFKMTMLDPHPAHNHPDAAGNIGEKFYSANPNRAGRRFEEELINFQDRANDPEVFVPGIVNEAEVFFQHTDYRLLTGLQKILNIWGEDDVIHRPSLIVTYFDLTRPGLGHEQVHDWYQAHVIPSLGGQSFAQVNAANSVTRNGGSADSEPRATQQGRPETDASSLKDLWRGVLLVALDIHHDTLTASLFAPMRETPREEMSSAGRIDQQKTGGRLKSPANLDEDATRDDKAKDCLFSYLGENAFFLLHSASATLTHRDFDLLPDDFVFDMRR